MDSYKKEIDVRLNGSRKVELLSDVHIKIDFYGVGGTMIIPKGFKTDLASIPWVMQWWIKPADQVVLVPSIVHDYLYENREFMVYTPHGSLLWKSTKVVADKVFYQKVKDFGAGRLTACLLYLAVHFFGTPNHRD